MTVHFIALLGTDVVNDHLLRVHISYHSTVHCSNKQVFVWGSFLCFGFGSLWFSPLFTIFEMGLLKGCSWTSGVTALAFCSPVTLFPQPLHAESWAGQLFLLGGVDRCSWSMVSRMSPTWDHVSGGQGVQHVPHVLHTLQLLLTPQHSMFCRSLASMVSSCHSWPSEVICAARCWHLRSPESACIELQFYCSITAIADLCPKCKLAYLIY